KPQLTSNHRNEASDQSASKLKKIDELNISINHHRLQLTHLTKQYWPQEHYTKKQLISYYRDIATVLLPHLQDRPQVLNRFPDGIEGESFYQKNMENLPAWIESAKIYSEHEDKKINYLICRDEATLIYMVNLGCIEINPWLSRLQTL